MVTKIKDSATAQKAALSLSQGIEVVENKGEPLAPQEKTTSEKLFPEFMTDDGGVVNRPVKPFQDASKTLPAAATPESPSAPAPQGQTPVAQPPTAPIYIKPEDLIGKTARLKVDGVEQDVPAESLFKTNQLERHLNAQLMKLAQEKTELERERAALLTRPAPTPDPAKPVKQEPPVKMTPEMERIAMLEAQIVQLNAATLPARQESGIQRVEKLVKDRIGTDDFRSYFEKVREVANAKGHEALLRGNQQEANYYDSDNFYFETYKEMKIKELMAKSSTPAPNPNSPVLVTPQGAPVVVNNNGQPVSIPSFESSGGVPSRTTPDASWQSKYSVLFKRATESQRMEDWQEFYRHKTRSPE
jgi:hypothetical protein